MQIDNVRLRFATNSSSSHSMIFDPTLIGKVSDSYNEGEFGWDFFTLASKKAKNEYLATMLQLSLARDNMPYDMITVIIKGMGLPKIPKDSYIDHESCYFLPIRLGTNAIDLEFVKDFQKYFLREGMFVLGGNDNEEYGHSLYNDTKSLSFDGYYPDFRGWVSRKDDDWWILYNHKSGNRAIFSFEDNPNEYKPTNPLLVDFKITDYCSQNCDFCYMGSSIAGKHMEFNRKILNSILDSKIFEVALGGGEPTEHPDFYNIISYLVAGGIVVNFSTKNIEWFDHPIEVNKVLNKIGAFAFSVQTVEEIDKIYNKMNKYKYDLNKLSIQIIPDVLTKNKLKAMFKKCYEHNIPITLLGFKTVARGCSFERTGNESAWVSVLKECVIDNIYPTISVDTTIAAKTEDLLKKEGINKYLYHIHEGIYSMYIDGVENKCGPSSYEPDKLVPYNN